MVVKMRCAVGHWSVDASLGIRTLYYLRWYQLVLHWVVVIVLFYGPEASSRWSNLDGKQ